jgi:hypothetical protein
MAGRISYLGGIVRNGLVLNLDAAKLDSYPKTGINWNDISGNGNNGTLINGPTFNSENNGGIVFDGSNEYTDSGNILNYTSGNFTFSYWIYLNSLVSSQAGQGPCVMWKGSYATVGYYDQIGIAGDISFVTNQSGAVQGTAVPIGTIVVNNWYNICHVRNGSSIRIYVNGIDKTSAAGTHVNPETSTNSFRISNYNNGQFYGNFRLSQFLNYNRALSATEILQNYNALKIRYI